MPKQTINMFPSVDIDGQKVSVNKVFCEDGTIYENKSKEVDISFLKSMLQKKKDDLKTKDCDERTC